MMEIARGAALLTTQGVPVFGLSSDFKFIGGGFIGKVSVSGIIWIILTVFFALLLKYTLSVEVCLRLAVTVKQQHFQVSKQQETMRSLMSSVQPLQHLQVFSPHPGWQPDSRQQVMEWN